MKNKTLGEMLMDCLIESLGSKPEEKDYSAIAEALDQSVQPLINAAYEEGRESVRKEMREALGEVLNVRKPSIH